MAAEPPPGFEQHDKPRVLYVDIYFNDERIGRTLVRVQAGKLTFAKPEEVAALIEGLKDRPVVQKALAEPLAANTGKLCNGKRQDDSIAEDCGLIAPEIAGVILDEGRLRTNLFVNERYLDPLAHGPRKFLSRPDTGPSFVARADAAIAGNGREANEINIRAAAIAAWREGRLRSEASLSTLQGFLPENLTAEFDRPGWFYRAGFYRGIATPIVGETQIYGFGIASSTATRIDLGKAFGSPLAVFLPRPAFVDVLRDGRIVSTRFYQAGTRTIDTSDLPDGAYEVTLRIRETGGATREERRFFAKTDMLPPPDQPLYFADAGVIAERPNRGLARPSAVPIGRVGMRRRIATGLAVGADIAGTSRDGFAEGNVYYVLPFARLSASALVTPHRDWGAGIAAQVNYRRFGASATARYVRAARTRIDRPDEPRNYRFVNGSSVQLNLSLGYQFKGIRIGATGQWQRNDRPAARRTHAFGPNVHATLVDNPRHNVTVLGEFLKTDQGYSAFAKLVWRWQAAPNAIVVADAGVRAIRSDANRELREVGRIEAAYQMEPVFGHDIVIQPALTRDGPLFAGLQASGMGPLGRATGNVQYGLDGGRSLLSYGATYSGGLAIDRDGVAVGGRDTHLSGIIAKVHGPRGSGKFQLLVDGAPKLVLGAGQSAPVFLAPYKAYLVELKPLDGNGPVTNIGNMRRRVVLYPGTAQTVAWNVEPVIVVFGRALRSDGSPVANARIEGAVGVGETDERGYFQIEVAKSAVLTFNAGGVRACRIATGKLKVVKGIAGVGTIRCVDEANAAVPAIGKR